MPAPPPPHNSPGPVTIGSLPLGPSTATSGSASDIFYSPPGQPTCPSDHLAMFSKTGGTCPAGPLDVATSGSENYTIITIPGTKQASNVVTASSTASTKQQQGNVAEEKQQEEPKYKTADCLVIVPHKDEIYVAACHKYSTLFGYFGPLVNNVWVPISINLHLEERRDPAELCKEIETALKEGEKVIVDLENIAIITPSREEARLLQEVLGITEKQLFVGRSFRPKLTSQYEALLAFLGLAA